MLQLYNTLTHKKEPFEPLKKGRVGIYACGPTVYWFAHLGNMRAFLFADLLRRVLSANDLAVKFVMNITDVGHLTDDADEGEDKMLVSQRAAFICPKCKKFHISGLILKKNQTEDNRIFKNTTLESQYVICQNKKCNEKIFFNSENLALHPMLSELARFYEKQFKMDIKQFNIIPATEYPRATDNIKVQIQMIKDIEKNGFTYKTTDGIYFNTSKLHDYGILSGQKSNEKEGGIRVAMKEKKNATDFALWKFSYPNGISREDYISNMKSGLTLVNTNWKGKKLILRDPEMEWDAPWGTGFPGWHIECSAMSKKYLGFPFDIHTGGVDHIAVHHENELAQSIGCCGIYEARFWMHSEFLTVDGGKMSKSLGNLFTLQDLINRGYDPLAFRYLTLSAHYRTKLNFTWKALTASQNALHRLYDTVRDWDTPKIGCSEYEQRFDAAFEDDLNAPQALAVMWEMIEDGALPTSGKAQSMLKFDRVLGLGLEAYIATPLFIPEEVRALIAEREIARDAKDWSASDRLREQIEQLGFTIEDTPKETKVRQKRLSL
ncbi:cysteine--tRNA ligase [Candidatus Uhrbacteria bacterium]|nr:cysteine--tRNA ligase [Candidatus Uhrbacteria bacterium]